MKVNFVYYFIGAIVISITTGVTFEVTDGFYAMGGFTFLAAFLKEA